MLAAMSPACVSGVGCGGTVAAGVRASGAGASLARAAAWAVRARLSAASTAMAASPAVDLPSNLSDAIRASWPGRLCASTDWMRVRSAVAASAWMAASTSGASDATCSRVMGISAPFVGGCATEAREWLAPVSPLLRLRSLLRLAINSSSVATPSTRPALIACSPINIRPSAMSLNTRSTETRRWAATAWTNSE